MSETCSHTIMDSQTLDALRASIAKWESIVSGDGADEGADNCALCMMFAPECLGCPVMKKSGVPGCRRTPYYEFRYATMDQTVFERRAITPNQKEWAQAELDFLKSLLPPEHKSDEEKSL